MRPVGFLSLGLWNAEGDLTTMRLGERVTQWEGTAMRGRAWVSCLTLWWLCHHVTCTNLARCIASQIFVISSRTWRVDQGHLLFLPSETYCTLPITYGHVSSANEWATMRFWGVWLERPLNRKSEDICGKKRTHVFLTEEEKVWDLHDLNWLF